MRRCGAESLGYVCDRDRDVLHMIHHDSNVEPGQPHDWWIFQADDEEERQRLASMTGYQLINDPILTRICKNHMCLEVKF